MIQAHCEHMNECRALAKKSINEIYKIAAKVIVHGDDHSEITYAKPNIKLDTLSPAVNQKGRLGGASDTIHAETAVFMGAPCTQNGTLYVTDPVCPNCMKNAIEAGIRKIYIDEEGFKKPWYQNRHIYFEHISLPLAGYAGIKVFQIGCPSGQIKDLNKSVLHASRQELEPVRLRQAKSGPEDISSEINHCREYYKDRPHAIATSRQSDGRIVLLIASESYPRGLDPEDKEALEKMRRYNADNKYKIKIDPVTRLMMSASRHGLSLRGADMYCSHLPSARCQINAVGYGMNKIRIRKIRPDSNSDDLEAAIALHHHHILRFEFEEDANQSAKAFP